MTDPYRAMFAELVEALHEHTCLYEGHESELVARARALLAQSVEEGPSDEEIMELMPQQMRDDLAAAARALAGFDRAPAKAAGAMRIILNRHAVDHVRAALAKWGNHPESPDSSTQPIPLSERLPGPEDCTAQGWCWVFYRGFATWTLEKPLGQDEKHTGYTHWLPANALPTPEALDD
jgi:hypothetical protein